jgi:hypothetical protein
MNGGLVLTILTCQNDELRQWFNADEMEGLVAPNRSVACQKLATEDGEHKMEKNR